MVDVTVEPPPDVPGNFMPGNTPADLIGSKPYDPSGRGFTSPGGLNPLDIDAAMGPGPTRNPFGPLTPDQIASTNEAFKKAAESKATSDQQLSDATMRSLNQHAKDTEHYRNAEDWAASQIPGPWNAQKATDNFTTPPMEKFGSMAMVAAMIGSAFSKQPLTNALAAGGAAMEAINRSDMLGYQRAYQAWKDNAELARERFAAEHQLFNDTKSLFDMDMNKWQTESLIIANKYKNDVMKSLLEKGMYPEAWELIGKYGELSQNIQKSIEQGDINNARHASWVDLTNQIKEKHGAESADKWGQTQIDTAKSLWENWQRSVSLKGAGDPGSRILQEALQEYVDTGKISNLAAIQALANSRTFGVGGIIGSPEAKAQLEKLGWSDAAIDAAARTYNKTGRKPTNLGTRTTAGMITGAIEQRATELLQEEADKLGKTFPEMVDKRAQDWQLYKSSQIAIQRFTSGPQGNTTRSLGVVVDHLATLQQLGESLKNGNTPLFNRIAQEWAEQTGKAAPTNFDTAKDIVGTEIIKALGVAGAGTEKERSGVADKFNRSRSPAQLEGAIRDVAQPLLAGQLEGLHRQFKKSTGLTDEDFYDMLGPKAKAFLQRQPMSEEQPPVVGARKAPDGNWYVADPKRPGKYLRVE